MWRTVESSHISAIDVDGNDLLVQFLDGNEYRYFGASKHYALMLDSSSKGIYLNSHIKRHFEYVKL